MNLKILFLPKYGPQAASSRHRVYQYIQYLEAHGVESIVCPLFSDAYLNQLFSSGKRSIAHVMLSFLKRLWILTLASRKKYDLAVIHTEAFPYFPVLFEKLLIWKGIPYVLDYDDALFHQYDQHPQAIIRKVLGKKIATVVQLSDLVIAGNEYLAKYALQYGAKRVEILPTVIDLERYPILKFPEQKNDVFTIGWIGSPSTAEYLQQIAPTLATICHDGNAKLKLVGAGSEEIAGVDMETFPWREHNEVELMHSFDVGIMPLPDEPWARGKCGFKLIQYMACGLPVIASPVGVNCDLVEHGVNGFLATTQEEWQKAFMTLISDPELRRKMGEEGRRKIEQEYCLQVTAPRFVSMLEPFVTGEREFLISNDVEIVGDDVTVIIPALNAEKWLPELIQKIEAQTIIPKEVIIVDSSLGDKTQGLLKELQSFLNISSHRIKLAYPGHARNIGVGLAKTKWIAFLDCTTFPLPNWLEETVSVALSSKAVFVNTLLICEANTRFKQTLLATTYGNVPVKTLPGSLILKSVFEQSGGFIPDVRAGEDIEWKCRLESLGVKVATVNAPLLNYYGFPSSPYKAASKWFLYALSNSKINVYNLQKKLYLSILILIIILSAHNWNSIMATSVDSIYYVPHITKIFLGILFFFYFFFRSIFRPLQVRIQPSFLFPFRWFEVGLVGIGLDLVKAPGLVWGAILLLYKKLGIIREKAPVHDSKRSLDASLENKEKNLDIDTVKSFGDEWSRFDQTKLSEEESNKIFDEYFAIFPWDTLPEKSVGFDMGCGSGRWARLMAPRVGHLNCIDPSSALEVAKSTLSSAKNVSFHLASVDENPLPENSQDFGYSLGVLHHIPDTEEALRSCVAMLKPGAPFQVYLYYAFDNRSQLFKLVWHCSNLLRYGICRLPAWLKHLITNALAVVVYYPLARFALLLEKIGLGAESIPLSYYRNHSFYTMQTDARDRFGTPLEQRYTRKQITVMMEAAGLSEIKFSDRAPYWCAVGRKR